MPHSPSGVHGLDPDHEGHVVVAGAPRHGADDRRGRPRMRVRRDPVAGTWTRRCVPSSGATAGPSALRFGSPQVRPVASASRPDACRRRGGRVPGLRAARTTATRWSPGAPVIGDRRRRRQQREDHAQDRAEPRQAAARSRGKPPHAWCIGTRGPHPEGRSRPWPPDARAGYARCKEGRR